MKERKIVNVGITGASGHIGITLTEGLPDRYQLTLFHNRSEIRSDLAGKFKTVRADFSKTEQVQGVFEGLDAVIHLAAAASTEADWESVLHNNIIATYNVFEEARRAGVVKIVFASTNHTQHDYIGKTPMTLDRFFVPTMGFVKLSDPPAPDSYYGISKLFGENMGWYYSRRRGIQFTSLRIGSTFPQDDPSIWKGTDREGHARAIFLSKRDCVEAFARALEVSTDFLLAYAISNNDRRFFDLTETKEKLGFYPKDNAEDYF
jgi:nucleoside-diphosphate-sugar epimerase